MALGAGQRDVFILILKQGARLIVPGVILGVAGAVLLTRLLANLLYEVKASDPATFIGVAVLLGVVGLVASYIPARRAAKVDPVVALRYE
jgi:ABC-type antimicrobial peptide transport system permease subunit